MRGWSSADPHPLPDEVAERLAEQAWPQVSALIAEETNADTAIWEAAVSLAAEGTLTPIGPAEWAHAGDIARRLHNAAADQINFDEEVLRRWPAASSMSVILLFWHRQVLSVIKPRLLDRTQQGRHAEVAP